MKGQYLFKQSSMGNHGIWVHPEEKRGQMWIQSTALPHFYCLIYTSSNHIRCRLVEICEERKAYVKNECTLVFPSLTECHYFFPQMTPFQRLNFKALHICSFEGKFSNVKFCEARKSTFSSMELPWKRNLIKL